MELFAERGFAGTTVREVATRAGVSAPLVLHHFGSKQGLRDAVDAAILARFQEALDRTAPQQPTRDVAAREALIDRLVGTIGAVVAEPAMRGYLRRSLLEIAPGAPGETLARSALELARRELEVLIGTGVVRDDVDREYAAVQLLMLVFGPLLFAPVLADLVDEPLFSPAGVERRVRANVELLVRGLLQRG
jgi:AcrR family transcriptional regulator